MNAGHVVTRRFAIATLSLVGTMGVLVGAAIMGIASAPTLPAPVPTSAPSGVVITEDMPGWDCLRMGNRTCRVGGVLMTSIEDMPPPSDPYGQCLYALEIPSRVGGVEFSTEMCSPVVSNLG